MTTRKICRLHLILLVVLCAAIVETVSAAPIPAATAIVTNAASSQPEPAAYTLNARVFITGKAARQKGIVGTKHLKGSERELTTYLTYRDYRLVKKDSASVTLDHALTLQLTNDVSVSVSVVSSNRDLIKIQVVWKRPGEQDLNTKLNVVRNRPAMIGGPRHPAGGIYLLSLTVK